MLAAADDRPVRDFLEVLAVSLLSWSP